MKDRHRIVAALATALAIGSAEQANSVTIETVAVGDPGNAGELSGAGVGGYGPDRLCGPVSYAYNIGTYEVTADQYTEFLNAVAKTDTYGLYNASMGSSSQGCKIQRSGSSGSYTYSVAGDYANRAANYVSYWDACRFVNWLNNGQGDGDTETGTYTLNGYNGTDGRAIQRNPGSTWAVTSEDEWYKAAYYRGGGTNAGYWSYPTRSDSAPGRDLADVSGNNANYNGTPYPIQSPYYTTEAGEFQNSDSPFGTFDQGGNVWEWNESVVYDTDRGLRGGSMYRAADRLLASYRSYYGPTDESYGVGFRVVSIPEPGSVALLALGGLLGLARRRRRAR